jgi:glycerol-3-phosphate acyltransferase PlsY
MTYVLLLISAYVLGALPFSIWISQLVYKDDIRRHGSGNAGSTNMYRAFGFWAGFSTQLLDIAKGAMAASLPVLMLRYMPDLCPELVFTRLVAVMLLCGICAVLGHVYSFLAGFKGGKGVNTMLGMMLFIEPTGSGIAVLTFIIMLLLFRMVSVGSMVAVLAFNLYLWINHLAGNIPPAELVGVSILLLLLVVYTHRSNIARIRQGTERKVNLFGSKS